MPRTPTSFLLYRATCLATNQVYVGCTTKSLRERREEHLVSAMNGSPWKFHQAIRKYGPREFVWVEITTAVSSAQMFALERRYITQYNSYRSGLNSTPGGKGSASDGKTSNRKLPSSSYTTKPRRPLLRR